jgi:thiol-disulfide isomerase/thioredoxin
MKIALIAIVLLATTVMTLSSPNTCSGATTEVRQEQETAKYQIYHFGAEWCSPCRRLKRVWASNELVEKLKVLKGEVVYLDADTESHKNFFKHYRITSYPTCVIIKDGKEIYRFVGSRNSVDLLKILQDYLK